LLCGKKDFDQVITIDIEDVFAHIPLTGVEKAETLERSSKRRLVDF
jgi:hypothetical protein